MSASAVPQVEEDAVPVAFAPPVPETLQDLGVPPSLVEQIILKALFFRAEMTGRQLATHLGLNFSVIEPLVEGLKRQSAIGVKRSLGMGSISSIFALTDTGRILAREYLDTNTYAERVPVPLSQYSIGVQMQRLQEGWLTPEMLRAAYGHMVVSPELLALIGPAVNSGKSLLIYGRPGNGKTYLAEGLFYLECEPVYIPYAIEAQGNIIQLFDPIYHHPLEARAEEASVFSAVQKTDYDGRWILVKRPFIVSGGELTLEMLDLSLNPASKVYDAPFHLKANNGIYLIDDFGRQKVTPSEVLNRWIVPMERRIDFLNFRAGGKISVPFEAFLVFSTNLGPEQLGDEAFLRRIQYKMFLRSPGEDEFLEIFERVCAKENLPAAGPVLDAFLERHYRHTGKPFRRCHPRDVVTHAIDLIHFERLPYQLTGELLERAFDSTFVAEQYED